jgi:hypothetical protein
MNRWWAILPLIVIAAVPIWTGPSWPVIAIVGTGFLLGGLGIGLSALMPVTVASVLATVGYAAALWLGDGGADVAAATVFGLALLFLLDLSEFARRFRGAEVAGDVVRGQIAYWLGRAALIVAALAVLTACASLLSFVVPSGTGSVIAGSGVMIAFAAALYAGIIPVRSDD